MIKNAKRKGSRNELRAKKYLSEHGYKSCKAGASLGDWDLIAMNGNALLLIQCKSNIWPPPAERTKLEAFDAPWGAIKMMWRYDDRHTHPRIKVWANPGNNWEWVEIADLPVPIITPEGAVLQFTYTGASLKKEMDRLKIAPELPPIREEWPSEL